MSKNVRCWSRVGVIRATGIKLARIISLLLLGAFPTVLLAHEHVASNPNIVFILIDDLGYGEVQALNPGRCVVPTPNMDRLRGEGMSFADAHTSSSVCTPSRYGLITGRYAWRSRLQEFVLRGYDRPLIAQSRPTIASLLKSQGYHTAIIGKWHLGLDMATVGNEPLDVEGFSNVDWGSRIGGRPCELGFDSFFGISGSLDMAPWIYIDNDRFLGACSTTKEMRKGPKIQSVASHEDFDALDRLTDKALEYIQSMKGT